MRSKSSTTKEDLLATATPTPTIPVNVYTELSTGGYLSTWRYANGLTKINYFAFTSEEAAPFDYCSATSRDILLTPSSDHRTLTCSVHGASYQYVDGHAALCDVALVIKKTGDNSGTYHLRVVQWGGKVITDVSGELTEVVSLVF